MSQPTLSVLITNYNHGHYLPRALESVLGQSRPPDEIVVVDDGSSDSSLEVLEGYARRHPQIRLFRNEQNLGPVRNGIRAQELATCDYIFGVAADDYATPGFFEPAMELLGRNPGATMLCCDLTLVDSSGQVLRTRRLGRRAGFLSPDELATAMAHSDYCVTGPNSIFRRSALLEPGVVVPEARWLFDWLFASILAFRDGICYLPGDYQRFEVRRDSYHFRGHGSEEHRRVLEFVLNHLQTGFPDVLPRLRRSGNLDQMGVACFDLLVRDPRYRKLLSWAHVRRQLLPWARHRLSEGFPWLRRIYSRLFPTRYNI